MKKILVIGALVAAIAIAAWAAAPVAVTAISVVAKDTLVKTEIYGGTWANVTNVIWGSTDTSIAVFTVSGVALGNPGAKMYLGLSDDSAGATAAPTLDTVVYEFPKVAERTGGMVRMPFVHQYHVTTNSQTDVKDTCYLKMAVGGSSQSDVIYLEDVVMSVIVGDKSAAVY